MPTWDTIGKINMTPKGTFNSSLTYEVLDVVMNSAMNKIYIAKQNVPTNSNLNDTTYWIKILDVSATTSKTVTATTDANGNISLDLNQQSYVVTAVKATSWIATPWVSGSDNSWHARITGITGNPTASQSVTVTVYYGSV